MRTSRKLSLTAAILTIASCGFAAPAMAESHPVIEHTGFETDAFSNPNGIAVDESSGDVYVADIGTNTVYKFDASGNPVNYPALASNALTGPPGGAFSFPSEPGNPAAVAIDNSTSPSDPSRGDLYVMDSGHGVIDKFNANGEYVGHITGPFQGALLGLGIDPGGNVRVYTEGGTGSSGEAAVFDNSMANNFLREFEKSVAGKLLEGGKTAGYGFAVGPATDGYPSGDTYLLSSCGCIQKLGGNWEPLGRVDSGSPSDVAAAVDPATGHLYIDDQSSVGEWDTGGMNGPMPVPLSSEASSTGALVSTFGSLQLTSTTGQGGIAVNGASGRIYVSNPANGKVYVFASAAPAVAASKPSNVAETSATLLGTVDAHGVPLASCQFEYEASPPEVIISGDHEGFPRPVTVYAHSVPCEQTAVQIGVGTAPVRVTANVSGLTPGLLYYYRLVASNANGSDSSSGMLATAGPGFGVKTFEVSFLNKDGTPDTQAGSHPYKMVTNIVLNTRMWRREVVADSRYVAEPDENVKDIIVDLPPGLVGDPRATTQRCTLTELETNPSNTGGGGNCPAEAALGELEVEFGGRPGSLPPFGEPLYNMVPPHGVALQIGANFTRPKAFINNGVKAGGDYPVQAESLQIPAVEPIVSTRLTVFGVVGTKTETGSANEFIDTRKPFLTLPTGCTGPLKTTIRVDSYQQPGVFVEPPEPSLTRDAGGEPLGLTGCSKLEFPPTITVAPDTTNASTPSGLTVGVHISQKAAFNPEGLAESALRDTTVTLPEGVAINPSGGDNLEACTSSPSALPRDVHGHPTALGSPGDEIGYLGQEELNKTYEKGVAWSTFTSERPNPEDPGVNFCPNASKIATVKIKTPLLEHELEGAVYLASQNANPFGSLIAMYMVAEDPFSGTLIKLAGEVHLTDTGQIITTFLNTPDLPFEELQLHFFGGERAPLATPSRCGTYTTTAVFTPWDGNGAVTSESSFNIEHGPGGGPCPGATLPFNPGVNAGATNIQAGAFSPLTVTMNRKDGEQNLKSIEAHLPPGLSGVLTGVELCPEPKANEGLCGVGSLIGEATVSVGVGSDPFTVTGGKFYLTGPYNGHGGCTVGEAGCAPFGLTFEVPAKAGPFDLANTKSNHPACDCVVVRGKIELNPITAAITITSNPPGSPDSIPTSIEGIPLEIQHVNATTTRGDFQFNPTNCSKMALVGTVLLSEGGSSTISTPFQVTNCAALGFKPTFKVSTSGKTSRADGASLHVKLAYPKAPFGSQANVASVKVDLPKQLPSNLEALKHACIDTTFEANPAACPPESRVGEANATTPLLPVPLTGPAYFVSHGGAKFPELVIVLQGYGVTVDLHGETFIKNGITSSTFHTVPDVPVGTFELNLPERPKYAALAAPGGLCNITTTKIVKKNVKLRSKNGRTRTLTRKVKKTVAAGLVMPTAFTAQNGTVIHENTPIEVTGCAQNKKSTKTLKGKGHTKKKK